MIEPDYARALALLEELSQRRNQHAQTLGFVRRMWQEADRMVTSAGKRANRLAVRYWEHKREAYAEVWQVLDPTDFAAHVQQILIDDAALAEPESPPAAGTP